MSTERSLYNCTIIIFFQKEFVSKCPANVKNLIRLVKYWKKQEFRAMDNRRIPNSYVMELITIHLWEQNAGRYGSFDILKAFHSIMEALKNYRSLNIIWQTNYNAGEIPENIRTNRYI